MDRVNLPLEEWHAIAQGIFLAALFDEQPLNRIVAFEQAAEKAHLFFQQPQFLREFRELLLREIALTRANFQFLLEHRRPRREAPAGLAPLANECVRLEQTPEARMLARCIETLDAIPQPVGLVGEVDLALRLLAFECERTQFLRLREYALLQLDQIGRAAAL